MWGKISYSLKQFFLSMLYGSGIYGDDITLETLKFFHRRRVKVLAESGAELLAFETIPNKLEAKVIYTLYHVFCHVLHLCFMSL